MFFDLINSKESPSCNRLSFNHFWVPRFTKQAINREHAGIGILEVAPIFPFSARRQGSPCVGDPTLLSKSKKD